uniref:Uncharacterized protein n=1 Tax=Cucumis sativus TaxID=3659 RepID=A0A0A0LCK7_CUCSA
MPSNLWANTSKQNNNPTISISSEDLEDLIKEQEESVIEELSGKDLITLFANQYDLRSFDPCFSPLKSSDIPAHLTAIVKDCGVILA